MGQESTCLPCTLLCGGSCLRSWGSQSKVSIRGLEGARLTPPPQQACLRPPQGQVPQQSSHVLI